LPYTLKHPIDRIGSAYLYCIPQLHRDTEKVKSQLQSITRASAFCYSTYYSLKKIAAEELMTADRQKSVHHILRENLLSLRAIRHTYGATVFLGAFLLFLIQPIMGKLILPELGGASTVWSTSLLFFISLLTVGYLYAHGVSRLSYKMHVFVHGFLLCSAFTLIIILFRVWETPIIPPILGSHSYSFSPLVHVLVILFLGAGVPYFVLSTTSSLAQYWFGRIANSEVSPYRFYALSNGGSLLALLSYPVAVEPFLSLTAQGIIWSIGFLIYTICYALSLLQFAYVRQATLRSDPALRASHNESAPHNPTKKEYARWVGLAALPSFVLIATTTHITQGVAAIPLLWLIPLSVYFVTYILSFAGKRLPEFLFILAPIAALLSIAASIGLTGYFFPTMALTMSALFFCGMICHGELYRQRPHPRYLTAFYLSVSIGGALGAGLSSLAAPLLLKDLWEFPLGMAAVIIVTFWITRYATQKLLTRRQELFVYTAVGFLLVFSFATEILTIRNNTIVSARNFFGAIRIQLSHDKKTGSPLLSLINGRTLHGNQFLSRDLAGTPTTYYSRGSGIGLLFQYAQNQIQGPVRVGAIGLGAGTVASFCTPEDSFIFYEINPNIIDAAKNYFSYLRNCPAAIEIVEGDARISLERELRESGPRSFHIIIIDAFSDDSIPVHLLTKEAFSLYLAHQDKTEGFLAFHISNKYLDLSPLLLNLAKQSGLHAVAVANKTADEPGEVRSSWVLVSRKNALLRYAPVAETAYASTETLLPDMRVWTDDYSNLLSVLKWK